MNWKKKFGETTAGSSFLLVLRRLSLTVLLAIVLTGCSSDDIKCWPFCGKTSSGITDTTTDTTESVTLISPNGGETWEADGSKKESISWSKSAGVSAVKIEIYKSGVLQDEVRESDTDEGAYYILPLELITGTDYKIKITSTNDSTVYDFSDASFRILSQADTDG